MTKSLVELIKPEMASVVIAKIKMKEELEEL